MFNILNNLKQYNAKQRIRACERMHEKNIAFFARYNAQIADFLRQRGTGFYELHFTERGIEILDRERLNAYHPPGQLLEYSAQLAAPHHDGWIDKIAGRHIFRGNNEHGQTILRFVNGLYASVPGLPAQVAGKTEIHLPKLRDGRYYSGPVVFLGVFSALHVMHYLNKTVVRDIFIYEPDLDRFAVSCYFLDYAKIEETFGHILIHIGPEAPQNPIDMLINRAPVTAATWVRLLPAYADVDFSELVNRISLRWRALTEIFVPYDREIRNMLYGLRNLRAKLPVLYKRPQLSEKSTIAVVASGPSLNRDLEWLKANQDRLIIFCSISCIRVLKENGIRPDFQVTLDTEIDEPLFEQLQMDPDIPLIAYYKLDPAIAARFKTVLLVPEAGKANAVAFRQPITFTHPTTGNTMISVATWCRPAQLLIIGLDLGFRDARRSHVQGGWHDENEGIGHHEETGGRDHIAVRANFEESEGQILTLSYYNNARFHVQDALAVYYKDRKAYNLADGARIEGAEPKRHEEIELPEYPEKADDLAALQTAFGSGDDIWLPYPRSGKVTRDELFEKLLGELDLGKQFSWPKWANALDQSWDRLVKQTLATSVDYRFEAYSKLIYDLLGEWYRVAVLAGTEALSSQVYQKGLELIRETLRSLPWPEELDSVVADVSAAPTEDAGGATDAPAEEASSAAA